MARAPDPNTYFNGDPCPKGHTLKYKTRPKVCVECLRENNAKARGAKIPAPKTPSTFPPSRPGFAPDGRPWGYKE